MLLDIYQRKGVFCMVKKLLRSEFDVLYVDRFRLWQRLVNVKDFVRGTVVTLRRPCTYPRCRKCKQGERHPAIYLSVNKEGKTQLVYLPKVLQQRAKEWAQNYRSLQQIVEAVSDTNRRILRLLAQEERKKKKGDTT